METEESTSISTLFTDWSAAKNGTWFTTRSLYPEVPCFISPIGLPKCSNTSSYLSSKATVEEIRFYLKEQVNILRFNNLEHSVWMIKSAIISRLALWEGNSTLFKDPFYLGDLLNEVIRDCMEDPSYVSEINMEYTKYWYSDEIVKMSGDGKSGSPRSKAKQAARTAINAKDYIEEIKTAAEEYSFSNFNVKPTVKILNNKTGISLPTINKYGREYFIRKAENTKQRVFQAMKVYPEFKQQEIANLLNETKRAVRQYWK